MLDEMAIYAREGAEIPLGPDTDRIGDGAPETVETRRF